MEGPARMQTLQTLIANAYFDVTDFISGLIHREEGQDAAEYFLVIGVITIALVAAIAAGLPGAFSTVVTQACTEVVSVMDAAETC